MPLWLIALLFLVGVYWIGDYFLVRLSKAIATSVNTLVEEFRGEFRGSSHEDDSDGYAYSAGPEPGPARSLNDRLAYLYQGIEGVNLRVQGIERLLQPIAAIAGYRLEKIGWDRFLEIRRKTDEAIKLADEQEQRRKLMRDERGFPRLVYEDEVEIALQKGWTLEEYSVVLSDVGVNTINVIKAVREVTGLSLIEAKALVDGVPKTIKKRISKEEAATIRKKFEEVGAKVEVEDHGAN